MSNSAAGTAHPTRLPAGRRRCQPGSGNSGFVYLACLCSLHREGSGMSAGIGRDLEQVLVQCKFLL